MSSEQTRCPISDLPGELHNMIVDYLDTPSLLNLRITSRHFHRLIKKPSVAQLIACERTPFAIYKTLLYCIACERLRAEPKFPVTRPSLVGRYASLAKKETRICLDCCANHDFGKGNRVLIGKKAILMCDYCSEVKQMVGTECLSSFGTWYCSSTCLQNITLNREGRTLSATDIEARRQALLRELNGR